MDTVKIEDLLSVEDIGTNDVLPIVNGGNTKKVSIDQLGNVFSKHDWVLNKIALAISEAAGRFGFTPVVVQTLPTEDIDEHTIYLVPKQGQSGDAYDEYIYINNQWEHIGSTSIDLSNYLSKTNTEEYTPTSDYHPSTKKYVDDAVGSISTDIQYETMPIASGDNVGKIIQYVGETNQNYKNGNWYKCEGDTYEKLDGVSVSYNVYIDTGIIPSNHKIEVSFAWSSYVNDSHILGTSNTGSDPAWYIHFTSFSNKYYWGRNGQEANGGSFTTGEHIVVFNDGEDNELKIDGTVLDRNLCASPQPLELFRRSGNANFYGTFHYLKIWDKATGDLIMNLIPVLNENSELIFMNTVTNEILTPIGSGSITAGTPTGETFGTYEWKLTDNNIDSRIWIGSQTDYDNMESHNENTLYFID